MSIGKVIKDIKTLPGSTTDIVEFVNTIIDNGYLKQKRDDAFSTKKTFSPSQLGYGHGKCPRYWYLAFDGAEFKQQTDTLAIANMAYGSQAHERIQSIFEGSGTLVAKEIEIRYNDPPIYGYVDLLITMDGEKLPGEIKTTRQEAFIHREMTKKAPDYHMLQLLLYMYVMNKSRGFFIYENKNDQCILVIPITMDEKNKTEIENVLNWMREVRKAWELREQPKRPYTRRNKICKECPLAETCWQAADGIANVNPLEFSFK